MIEHFYQNIVGWTNFEEAYRRIAKRRPRDVVEVGSFRGRSAAFLGVELLRESPATRLHLVENFAMEGATPGELGIVMERLRGAGLSVTLHADGSPAAAAPFVDGSLDAVWIDGDHSLAAVQRDIDAWLPKVAKGGMIGGDDWLLSGVREAVEAKFRGRYLLGPGRFEGYDTWLWWWVEVQ